MKCSATQALRQRSRVCARGARKTAERAHISLHSLSMRGDFRGDTRVESGTTVPFVVYKFYGAIDKRADEMR